MSQPIRTLARTLLVPAALAAVAFAGQSAASASTLGHYRAQPGAAVAAAAPAVHFVHFRALPEVHFAAQPKHHFARWA
jgi:hypothetical protein